MKIGMNETPLFQWFLREDGRTWHYTVQREPGIFAMILAGREEEEGQFFPETNSGEARTECLHICTDIEAAKIQCLHKLKTYMNQQVKSRQKNKKRLQDSIKNAKISYDIRTAKKRNASQVPKTTG